MKVLSFAGSLRLESSNKKLAQEANRLLEASLSASAKFVDLRDYPMPVYDGDHERDEGIPDAVQSLALRISQVDALIISTPEYNGGISSVLKNTIDWLSRVRPMPLRYQHALLLSASPGRWGGVRGLWHSRIPLEALGVHVFPDMMSLPNAGSAFDKDGHLVDEQSDRLRALVAAFLGHAGDRVSLKAA